MSASTKRQQLMLSLRELFPGDDLVEFRGIAVEVIFQMPVDWAAGLLNLPVGDRKEAIMAGVRGGGVLMPRAHQ
jgi:hypothetical protein